MAETLIATSLLLPIWLAVVYVSRWHDLQHTTIAAARHAAFEAHVSAGREGRAHIESTTRLRLFSRDPRRFELDAVADDVGERPQWSDHRGSAALLARDPGPGVDLVAVPQPAVVAGAEQQVFMLIAPARAVGGPPLDLQREAARGATVTVPLQHADDLPPPFRGLRLQLSERLRLLVDPWAARDPRQVAARVESLSPVGRLSELVQPLEPVRWAVSLFEPAVQRLCLGRIEPDIVPPDRLVGARGPALDLRTRPC